MTPRTKRRSLGWRIVPLAGLLAGCGSPTVMEIVTDPPGATVFVNGELKGVTNTKVELNYGGDPNQRVAIQVMKENFKPVLEYLKRAEVVSKKEYTLEQE
jgi:PEGA domain-containing protein